MLTARFPPRPTSPKISDVAQPPPGVKTSPGPPSGKPSVIKTPEGTVIIKTPEGTAVIDHMRVQPPPGIDVGTHASPQTPTKGAPQLPPGSVKTPWGTIEQVMPVNKISDVAQPPPGVATSSGPPSGKPSVIKTPEGTAVIDYMRVQPPPILEKQTKGQKAVGGSQQTVIESTIYTPHVLEEWKILKPRILEELISPERGGTATPPPEPVVYAPPENLGGLLVAEEVGVAREEARRRRPLYT